MKRTIFITLSLFLTTLLTGCEQAVAISASEAKSRLNNIYSYQENDDAALSFTIEKELQTTDTANNLTTTANSSYTVNEEETYFHYSFTSSVSDVLTINKYAYLLDDKFYVVSDSYSLGRHTCTYSLYLDDVASVVKSKFPAFIQEALSYYTGSSFKNALLDTNSGVLATNADLYYSYFYLSSFSSGLGNLSVEFRKTNQDSSAEAGTLKWDEYYLKSYTWDMATSSTHLQTSFSFKKKTDLFYPDLSSFTIVY